MARQAGQSGLGVNNAGAKLILEEGHFGAQGVAFPAQNIGIDTLAGGHIRFLLQQCFRLLEQSGNCLKFGLPAQGPGLEL